jgi:carboxypeptidase Taq
MGATLRKQMPDFFSRIEKGDFAPILGWLREHVHAQGHLLEAPEIVRAAVGERDHVADLLDYLWERMGETYGVRRVP